MNTYKFFNDYGFASKKGNKTSPFFRWVAKVLHKLNGDKKLTLWK